MSADAGTVQSPDVLCVSIIYAQAHLQELLRHVDEGGWCLIRDDRQPGRQYWLGGQAPPWWQHMDDTALAHRVLSARARQRRRPAITPGRST